MSQSKKPNRPKVSDEYSTIFGNPPPEVKVHTKDGLAITGFILGLASAAAWIMPLFGGPVTIAGIAFSVYGLKAKNRRKLAWVGLVLSGLFLIATVINFGIAAHRGYMSAISSANNG